MAALEAAIQSHVLAIARGWMAGPASASLRRGERDSLGKP
jgi:hypothetical protein